jgi:hypothetical protein
MMCGIIAFYDDLWPMDLDGLIIFGLSGEF